MTSSTGSIFRTSALLSGLISQEDLDRGLFAVRNSLSLLPTQDVTDESLAEKLVELGLITTYQADQLRAGRTKLNLGPYVVTDWIGQGGMGQVYKAVHKVMGRECAVKVLPLNRSTPESITHFTREIRTQAKLDHPNLVRAYDAGHDGKVHYFVTEYVPGTDLRRLIRSQGPLTMQQAASVIRQAADALDYAHQRDLIHRDVKPGNILVTPEGVAKLSDLGLAGCLSDSEEDPRAGKIVGTADYLSPEQIRNPYEIRKVSDIYSLGCTLYYAVTGKVPFPGGTAGSKARRHLDETPMHPRRFNPDISEEFVDIIADMMEKDPDTRIQTAAEVVTRLEPWAVETGPLPSRQWGKSPWTAPPLPTDNEDTDVAASDLEDLDSQQLENSSQVSQGTHPLVSGSQETKRVRTGRKTPVPPPLPASSLPLRRRQLWLIMLLLAIPASLAAGLLLGFLLWGR
jgi:serine/threonine protein kinase